MIIFCSENSQKVKYTSLHKKILYRSELENCPFFEDADGFISAQELWRIMASLREKLTDDEVQEMIEETVFYFTDLPNFPQSFGFICSSTII